MAVRLGRCEHHVTTRQQTVEPAYHQLAQPYTPKSSINIRAPSSGAHLEDLEQAPDSRIPLLTQPPRCDLMLPHMTTEAPPRLCLADSRIGDWVPQSADQTSS